MSGRQRLRVAGTRARADARLVAVGMLAGGGMERAVSGIEEQACSSSVERDVDARRRYGKAASNDDDALATAQSTSASGRA